MTGIRNIALVVAATASLTVLATTAAHAQSGHLTIQQLGESLTSYGKNTVTSNGQTYYTVNCGNGNWKSRVIISLSPDQSVVWMTIDPSSLPDGSVSIQALANLLQKNNDIGPIFFSFNRRNIRLSYPVANNGLTDAKVKDYVKELVDTAVDTMPLWDPAALAGK